MILRHTEYRVSFFKDETKNGCRKKFTTSEGILHTVILA